MQAQLLMADDDTTPSNPLVAAVQQQELEEASLNLNVSQRLREEESPRRVVRTQSLVRCGIVDCLLTHVF
jgi:hypothetical protein